MTSVVDVTNISKTFRYKRQDFFAVKSVSFTVEKGEIFGLLGPNGAGKTTIINMIVGILVPDVGSIKVFGKNVQKDASVLEEISLSSGGSSFHGNLRTRDILNFYAKIYGLDKDTKNKRLGKLVRFFGLEDIMERKSWYLSTGERMRLSFARTLLNYPKLLLLDEPTLGLDPDIAIKVRDEIKRINRKFGTTIVLTSHYMHEVEQLCNRIAFIDKGSIIDMGSIEKVKMKQFSTYDVFIKVAKIRDAAALRKMGFKIKGNILHKKIEMEENITAILAALAKKKVEILNIETKKPTMEDYFVKILDKKDVDGAQ